MYPLVYMLRRPHPSLVSLPKIHNLNLVGNNIQQTPQLTDILQYN